MEIGKLIAIAAGYTAYAITLLEIAAIIEILSQRRRPASLIGWIMAIVFVPGIGVLLYYLFGNRKLKSKLRSTKPIRFSKRNSKPLYEVEKILTRRDIPPSTLNNRISLCKTSKEAYCELVKMIQEAKKEILVEVYLFKNDETGAAIARELAKKAKEGVDVKILIDAFGSIFLHLFPNRVSFLERSGAKLRFFMPIFSKKPASAINLRNHRKAVIVDNKKVFTGGMNIGSEYLGPKTDRNKWLDAAVIIEGEAVSLYREIFAHDWEMTTGEKIKHLNSPPVQDRTRLQVVPSGPDIKSDAFYEALLSCVFFAKKRIWIITPYFIPDDSLMEALIIAAHRGVDVKIVTPLKSNHPSADFGRIGFLRELLEEGVEILLYKKMMHQKLVIVDEDITILGSANIDVRSLFYNFEVMNFIYSEEFTHQSVKWLLEYLKDSVVKGLPPASKPRRIIENIGKIISPVL